MLPFPDTLPDPLIPDADLQVAFDDTMTAAAQPLSTVPFTIVALDEAGGPHGFAGQLGEEFHYSASVLKVAAMYAAFELRKAANDLLAVLQPPEADVFPALSAEFDGEIQSHLVPQLGAMNAIFLMPKYDQIFATQPTGATASVNFTPAFFGSLHDAIGSGKNAGAADCIHKLGYGYLTGVLSAAGFFDPGIDPDAGDGIWLCGDFGNGFPPKKIESVNDGPVAQAMSTNRMARLFTLLFERRLVDPLSSDAMMGLLATAMANGQFFLSLNGSGFATFQTKVGLGPLKTGTQVASEAAILRHISSARPFVAVWQNKPWTGVPSGAPVSQIVSGTLDAFVL